MLGIIWKSAKENCITRGNKNKFMIVKGEKFKLSMVIPNRSLLRGSLGKVT